MKGGKSRREQAEHWLHFLGAAAPAPLASTTDLHFLVLSRLFCAIVFFFFFILFFPLSPSFPPHRLEINTTTPAVHDAAGATRCSPRERRCICKVDQPARRCTETRHRVAIGCFWWSCATQTCLEAHVLRMFQPLLASSSVFFFFL